MAAKGSGYVSKMKQDVLRRSRECGEERSQIMYADIPPNSESSKKDLLSDEGRTKDIFSTIAAEFSGSGPDGDKLLIAALIYLLIKEGGDKRLIFALGYILL